MRKTAKISAKMACWVRENGGWREQEREARVGARGRERDRERGGREWAGEREGRGERDQSIRHDRACGRPLSPLFCLVYYFISGIL